MTEQRPTSGGERKSIWHQWWQRLRHTVLHSVIGLDDSPHRIALGVLLGCIVGATPTLGFQILLYLGVATLFRANKVSGLPAVMASNPVTAIPLYYFNWRVGVLFTPGHSDPEAFDLVFPPGLDAAELMKQFFSSQYWDKAGDTWWLLFLELWFGCLIVGGVLGVLFYFITLRAVAVYRARRPPAEDEEQR